MNMDHVITGDTNTDSIPMDQVPQADLMRIYQSQMYPMQAKMGPSDNSVYQGIAPEMQLDQVQMDQMKSYQSHMIEAHSKTVPEGGVLEKVSRMQSDQVKSDQLQVDQVKHHQSQMIEVQSKTVPEHADQGNMPQLQLDQVGLDLGKTEPVQGGKRKRVVWDIPTKLKILERLGSGERAVDLAREYGVGRSTISDMKSTESKLREFLSNSNNDNMSRCTMKQSSDENLDRLLYNWFIEERNRGTHLSGPIIRDKARWFHQQLHPGDGSFSASQGWLRRWKERHGLTGSVFNLFMGGTKSPGRHSRILDIPAKLKIIERLDNGEQVADLAKEYGVGKTTITSVMSAKAKLMVYQLQSDPTKAEKYTTKHSSYEHVDKTLYEWYMEEKSKGTALTGPAVKEKAKWFHDKLYPGNTFKASEGWLWRWKKRRGINGPISNNTGNHQKEEAESEASERDNTDPTSEIQAIESTLAHIKSEETKLREQIYGQCRSKREMSEPQKPCNDGHVIKRPKKDPDVKRKRVVLDIPTKLKIIERVNNGEKPVNLAREFGLGRSTITDMKLSEEKLKMFMSTSDSNLCSRQTMRQPTYDSVDKALYLWYKEEIKKALPMPGNILRDKARILHSQLYPDDSPFIASEGWLRRWKERHGLLSPVKSYKSSTKHERKKRVVLDVPTKLRIIERIHKGDNSSHLAKEYGVSKTTINDIKAAEDKLKEYMASCSNNLTSYTIEQCYEALNKAMCIWYLQERNKGTYVSSPVLEAKAMWFHSQLHPACLVVESSEKWLDQWKSRYGVFQPYRLDETSPSVGDAIERFKKHLADWMVEIDIGPEQLYSAEESTLYWNLLPPKALACASASDVFDYQRWKDYVTVLACTNSSGCHKLPLLLLGKSDNPECLSLLDMTNLSIQYAAQKNALVSTKTFTEWFTKLFVPEVEKHLHSQGLPLRAALLVENSPVHLPTLAVETCDGRIECVLLPTSSASVLHPMKQGPTQFLKHHFRKNLVQRLMSLKSSFGDIIRNLSLCDCILMIDSAWKSLTCQHVLKSWEKSSLMQCFPNSGPVPHVNEEFDIDAIGLSAIQEAFGASLSRDEIHEWLNCDQQVNSWETMTDSEIVEDVTSLCPPQTQHKESAESETRLGRSEPVIQEMNDDISQIQKEFRSSFSDPEPDNGSDSDSESVVKYVSFEQSECNADESEDYITCIETGDLLPIKSEPDDYHSDVSSHVEDQSDEEVDSDEMIDNETLSSSNNEEQ